MKMTLQQKKRQRSKVHGFRQRMSTKQGRRVLSQRRKKGRKKLTVQFQMKKSIKKTKEFRIVYNNKKSCYDAYFILYIY